MTSELYLAFSRRFQRTHFAAVVLATAGGLLFSSSTGVSVLCGASLGSLFLWALLRAGYPMFVSGMAGSRRAVWSARALILAKPLAFFALVWLFLGPLKLDPLPFTAGILILPASVTIGAMSLRKKVLA